jgi:hypothetical protein
VKKIIGLSFVLTLAFVTAQANQGDFIDHGFYTEDTLSGSYWLDVTETQGASADEVIAAMAPGGRYEGWRYATRTELETMLLNFGFWAQNNDCEYTGNLYCDTHSGTSQYNRTKQFVALFGDTQSIYDVAVSLTREDIEGNYGTYGMLAREGIASMYGAYIREYEHTNGTSRNIWSGGNNHGMPEYDFLYGSFLIRETVPAALPPLPPTNIPGAIDFETLFPADLGLQFICEGGSILTSEDKDNCAGSFMLREENSYTAPAGDPDMWLGLPSSFDRTFTPWLRVTGFDYRPFDWRYTTYLACDPHANGYIDVGNGRIYIDYDNNAVPAPQGQGWCRVTVDSGWVWLPQLQPDPDVPGVTPVVAFGIEDVTSGGSFYADGFYEYAKGFGFDNIVVATVNQNITIDFNPYDNTNEARPKDAYFFTIGVKTQTIAYGDAEDFDATTIELASVSVGPAQASNVAAPITADFDGDGDDDIIFGFRMEDTGIDCLDNNVTLSGTDADGNPLAGTDLIVTINCEEPTTIDVDPFNAENEIRPNDSYTVPVAILSTQVANGDPGDIDATQIDLASLRFGPNKTPHTGSTVVGDIDGDFDTDVIFGFDAFSSGIACGDTELVVEGQLASGLPILGQDTITTVECTTGCHP